MKVTVDQDVCVGAGQCAMLAPDVFDQSDEGTVVLLAPDPPAASHPAVRDAVIACPSGAVRLAAQPGG